MAEIRNIITTDSMSVCTSMYFMSFSQKAWNIFIYISASLWDKTWHIIFILQIEKLRNE